MIDQEQITKVNNGMIEELEQALKLAREGQMFAFCLVVVREDNNSYDTRGYHSGTRLMLLASIRLAEDNMINDIQSDPQGVKEL